MRPPEGSFIWPQGVRIVLSHEVRLLLFGVPALLVCLVGVVLSLVYRKRCPKAATFALIGCGTGILIEAVFPFIHGYIYDLVLMREGDVLPMREGREWGALVLTIVETLWTLLFLTAEALVIAGVFVGRGASPAAGNVADTAITENAFAPPLQPHRATLVLLLGILSLIVCAPLGIAAWIMGSNDLAAMRSGRMDRSGESVTAVGQILGIIGTVFFALGIVGALVVAPGLASWENPVVDYLFHQLNYLVPNLLVYSFGMDVSIAYRKRCPKPAMFALVGCGFAFLKNALVPVIQGFIIASPELGGDQRDQWFFIVAIVGTRVWAAAFSMVLAGVFVGRKAPSATAGLGEKGTA
jgi:hypothetical protein